MRPLRTDRNGLEVLRRADCLVLLASSSLGRVAVGDHGRPVILPVNYVVDDDDVVFRTGAGSKLYAAARGRTVAFEVDYVDPADRSGWSVVVTGVPREVTDVEDRTRLADRLPQPLAPHADVTHLIRLATADVSGRRTPTAQAGVTGLAGPAQVAHRLR